MENVDNTPEHSADGTSPSSLPQPPQNANGNETRNRKLVGGAGLDVSPYVDLCFCSLDILKAYIQRQRALLERIRQDVDRLQASKPAVLTDPSGALSRILQPDANESLGDQSNSRDAIFADVSKLSELVSEVHGSGEQTITKDVDWDLFRGSGAHSFASSSRAQF